MKLIRTILAVMLCACCLAAPVAAQTVNKYAHTRYPIVLVHGVAGVSKYLGVVDYWWNIAGDLREHGATVHVADVNSFAGEDLRGEELLRQIRVVLAATGAEKVNLIAHSQGGYTVRYAAAVMPQAVASVTTIGSPHRGTPIADWIAERPSLVRDLLDAGTTAAGSLLSLLVGQTLEQDPDSALHLMTTEGTAAFNRDFPTSGLAADCSQAGAASEIRDNHKQLLFSWSGNVSGTNLLDVFDPAMVLGSATIVKRGGGENDGLVPVCSTRFGRVIGTYAWNHIDEVNHMFGLRGLFSADPVVTIRTHANRLAQAGL
jgi:triacylglycerol lipase